MEANIYYEQGQRSFYNGEYREAGKLLREAASLGLRDALFFMAQKADELNNRGVLYDKQGNIELANRYYKFAIELMPEDDDALLNLARNYEKAGKLQESISLCLKAIRISPKRYMSYAIIGDVFYYGTDDVEQAVEWYKKAYKYGDWEIG